MALSQHLGMQTCVSQDRPGFLVNRMLLPLINEAFFLLMEVSTGGQPPATLCKLLPAWLTCDLQALQKLSQLVFRSCLNLFSLLTALCFWPMCGVHKERFYRAGLSVRVSRIGSSYGFRACVCCEGYWDSRGH